MSQHGRDEMVTAEQQKHLKKVSAVRNKKVLEEYLEGNSTLSEKKQQTPGVERAHCNVVL